MTSPHINTLRDHLMQTLARAALAAIPAAAPHSAWQPHSAPLNEALVFMT